MRNFGEKKNFFQREKKKFETQQHKKGKFTFHYEPFFAFSVVSVN